VRNLDAMWVNPEARPLLDALAAKQVKLALVTNTVSPLATQILERAKLSGLFGSLATADRVKNAKPSPELVQLACRELNVAPGDAWMVGDSRFDRAAAQAAGVFFVGLGLDGDRRVERLAELTP
jgi:HAD superfamily hydrolase (TIGR01549 family)